MPTNIPPQPFMPPGMDHAAGNFETFHLDLKVHICNSKSSQKHTHTRYRFQFLHYFL